MERAEGILGLRAAVRDGQTTISDLHQQGSGRFLFPARATADPLEAVVVNVGGGLTGGDRFQLAAELEPGAEAVITTQAAEKIYRSSGGAAVVDTRLSVAAGARLAFLPQETIVFDAAHLERSLHVHMAEDATVLLAESLVFGRLAMGETLTTARFRDSWRVKRGGQLVFAEEARCDGDWARVRTQAALGVQGGAAMATVVRLAPQADTHVEALRVGFTDRAIDAGVSAFDGMLVVRMVAHSPLELRHAMAFTLSTMMERPLPRIWQS